MENKTQATGTPDHTTMRNLTRGSLLAKNTMMNLVFQAVPVLIALFTIPVLIKGMGTDRFGVLSIAWIMIGYFSLFDFGIARVLIKMIGEKLANNEMKEIPPLFWTGLTLMAILGVIVGLAVAGASDLMVYRLLKIPDALKSESVIAFWAIGATVPLVITTMALWGSMEAKQSFLQVNIVRTMNSVFTLLLPILALQFTKNIGYIVMWLAAGRLVLWFVSFAMLFSVLDVLKTGFHFSKAYIRPILKLGGWMTVSNIISPFMVNMDRFLIGILITITAVTYYVTPYEVVTKILLIPVALNRVLFPAFSASYGMDRNRALRIYEWGRKFLWVILFPVILVIVAFAAEGLNIWVGQNFVEKSTFVMQCLAIGVFFNAPAQVAFVLIQGAGRPDITGKLHLIELPLYLLLFWFLVHSYGINGAAIAWSVRVISDAILMIHYADKLLHVQSRRFFLSLMLPVLMLVPVLMLHSLVFKAIYVLVLLVGLCFYIYKLIQSIDIKALLMIKRPG